MKEVDNITIEGTGMSQIFLESIIDYISNNTESDIPKVIESIDRLINNYLPSNYVYTMDHKILKKSIVIDISISEVKPPENLFIKIKLK